MLEVHRGQIPEALIEQGRKLIAQIDSGDGVLMLTDAFGSTPSNIAVRLAASGAHAVVAGVNLPMLIRIFNYPRLSLSQMVDNAVEAGRRGVLVCPPARSGA